MKADQMTEMQWGIIGPGHIAHEFIGDLYRMHPAQTVKAVLGRRAGKTEAFGRRYGIAHCYEDMDAFLQERPDVVYIATPHALHYEHALACLEEKIPVLCEKPMTVNASQCRYLISLSQMTRTFLMEGMWIRFLPAIRQVLDIVSKGMIGEIISVKASIGFKAPHTNNRFFNPALGGGSLLDLGVYPVFLASLLLGRPDNIIATGRLTGESVDETCRAVLHYQQGASAFLESSLVVQPERPAEIKGEKGVVRILHPWFEKSPGIELHLYHEKESITYPCRWEGKGFRFEAEEVIKCLRNGQISSNIMPHALTLETIEIMDEIRRQIHVAYETA